ncbi:MAG: hypothetical protein QNJ69_09605 [Gammaproteobacteria bacterium]|nr:hypothetical protein [Gammaproteobacteria bacterium]
MTKLRAALIHLALSSTALLLLAAATLFYWYPFPHFKYEGVLTILAMITLVDVVLGPMVTFIVYKKGKPSLKFDLSVIAVVQIAAFVYGGYTIESQHPEFVTYADGVMYTIPTSAIDEQLIEDESLRARIHVGPKLAVASLPDDPQAIVAFTMAQATEGKTLLDSPEFYRSYPPPLAELAQNALNIDQLSGQDGNRQQIEAFLSQNQLTADEIYLLGLVSHLATSVIVLDKQTAMPIGYLDIRP